MTRNYLLVTKPGIVFGNLITATGGFLLASRGRVDIALLLPTIIGITLVVASGCVFNNYIDRDIDRKMTRTRNRVLPRELLSPKAAVLYASLLGMAGMILLWTVTTILCAAIVLGGFVIYVGVYSLYLKRRSVYGVLIGSLAGAAPPLAGYCAVTGFDAAALLLLAIFSSWQIPHWYAIAIFRCNDYVVAAIPVLPVEHGMRHVRSRIAYYIVPFIAAALMLTFAGYAGYGYLAVASTSGLSWLCLALLGWKTSDDCLWARRQFLFSLLSIFVLSVMMSIDFTEPALCKVLLTGAP
jgi:protoheme IX farnesyltransferase